MKKPTTAETSGSGA
jgi:hypothetical protein